MRDFSARDLVLAMATPDQLIIDAARVAVDRDWANNRPYASVKDAEHVIHCAEAIRLVDSMTAVDELHRLKWVYAFFWQSKAAKNE